MKSGERLRRLYAAAVIAVTIFLTVKAFFEFNLDWDYLSYHLPDALRRVGLTTYRETSILYILNQAFPPLPHIVQGLFVRLGGRISFANGLNAASLLMLVGVFHRLFRGRFSIIWFLTVCFAVPLIAIQYCSGYIDVFVGALLTLALGALVFFEFELERTGSAQTATRHAIPWISAGLCGAMLSKFHAWPIVGIYFAAFFLRLALLVRESKLSRRDVFIVALALTGFIAIWPARNVLIFANPVYPYLTPGFAANAGGRAASPHIARAQEEQPPPPRLMPIPEYFLPNEGKIVNEIPPYLRNTAPPIRFIHSVFELNRLVSPEPFHWTYDQYHSPGETNNHSRMGGWFFATMATVFAALFALIRRKVVPNYWVGTFLAAVAVTALFPGSHQLRYWLYIPLSLALFIALGLRELPLLPRRGVMIGLALCMSYVLTHTVDWSINFSLPARYAPHEARYYWSITRAGGTDPVPICNRAPKTIFWAGPTFNEFPIQACYAGKK